MRSHILAASAAAVLFVPSCATVAPPAHAEVDLSPEALVIERITTAVPWPRGVRYVDGKLYALARGVHRSAGGPQAAIEDHAGSIYVVDPTISEPVATGVPVGDAVRANGRILAAATSPPFRIWDRAMPATRDTLTDRPYCMLVYDPLSQNFFVCGYSGIDLAQDPKFRKNATDSVHRYDLRSQAWQIVEAHDPSVVPEDELGYDVSSVYYPHHDVAHNSPPHGLVNGPCGAVVAGRYLYVGAKDNSSLAQYDLTEIRRNPDAGAPPARYVFEGSSGSAVLQVAGHGAMRVNGTCALAVHGDFLYVAFRTTSQILRLRLDAEGDVVRPIEAEYIAQFATYDPAKKGGSANIYDMEFDTRGRLYVSPGYDGAIYRFTPDPHQLYDATTTDYAPLVDLHAHAGATKTGNLCFDDAGNLYVCSGQELTPDDAIRGVIYRISAPAAAAPRPENQ